MSVLRFVGRNFLVSRQGHQNWKHLLSTTAAAYGGNRKKFVIVGGVAGGATAAARLRRLSEEAEIVVLERGPDVSFANCGLPYHIGGEIKERSNLLLHTPRSLSELLAIEVRTESEVVKIDRVKKEVLVAQTSSGRSGTIAVPYDKLLISTGAAPLVPPIEGIRSSPKLMTLRNVQDMDKIIRAIADCKAKKGAGNVKATVIGAGFIGLEMVEALIHQNIHTTLVEARPQVLPQMDPEMTRGILEELVSKGVTVLLGDRAKKFAADPLTEEVAIDLESGKTLGQNDLVILSVGVAPESELARKCGLEISPTTKAVMVSNTMQTRTDEDIFAVGDCAQAESSWSPLAGPANRQARIAAFNMLYADEIKTGTKKSETYRGSIKTAIVRFGDVVAATTGDTESYLQRTGKKDQVDSVIVTGVSHASYYPGATPIVLKVTYDKTTRKILGGQAYGSDGIDKRIDIIATAISGGLCVEDLEHLELCYSPPFGSARDIVNTAGFLASNVQRGLVHPTMDPLPKDHQLIDVRPTAVSSLRPMPGAINIPLAQLRDKVDDLKQSNPNGKFTVACAFGKTSYFASRIMLQSGLSNVYSLMGGFTLHKPIDLTPRPRPSSSLTKDVASSSSSSTSSSSTPEIELDTCGLACPGPILKIRQALSTLQPGQVLRVLASDSGFANDFEPFCKSTGMEFLDLQKEKGIFTARLRKPFSSSSSSTTSFSPSCSTSSSSSSSSCSTTVNANASVDNKDVAIVLFSGDLDKALAAFVIANGAIAMGGKATIFCTFWGLNALRASTCPPVHKSFLDRAMGWCMPQGVNSLTLSKMNFGGVGSKFMKWRMGSKNLPNLPDLLQQAVASGQIKLVACGMSMEALGIKKEELIPQCELGGVAQFLGVAQEAKNTLFI